MRITTTIDRGDGGPETIEAEGLVELVLALCRRLTPERLGRLRRDDLHAVQRELRGVPVVPKPDPEKEPADAPA